MLIPHPAEFALVENGLLKASAIFDVMGKYSLQPQKAK